MSRINLLSTLGVVLGVTLGLVVMQGPAGRAQLLSGLRPVQQTLIFDGDVKTDSGGIELLSWGSGKAEPVQETTYVGPEVLKITSQGPYQGVVLQLARPVDMTDYLATKDSYLDLRIRAAQIPPLRGKEARLQRLEEARSRTGGLGGARTGGLGGGGGAGGRTGGGRGGRRGWLAPGPAGDAAFEVNLTGGMMGGGRRGGGGRIGGGRGGRVGGRAAGAQPRTTRTQAQGATPQTKAFTATRLRVVLFTDQGPMMADSGLISEAMVDQRGWSSVVISLLRFKGAEGARELHALGVFADQPDVFYVGRIRLLSDRTPMKITIKVDPSITVTDQIVEFSAEMGGGAIENPRFAWDFDESDGIQRQAVGKKVKYIYQEPGDYVVTCTMTDEPGIRDVVTEKAGVRVEEGAAAAP